MFQENKFEDLFIFEEYEKNGFCYTITFFECTLLKDIEPFKTGDVVDSIRWIIGSNIITIDTDRYFVDYVERCLVNYIFR